MSTKEKLIEEIRAVPIAGKTYEEYVEALADKLLDNDYRKIYDDHARQCTCYALGCQMAEQLKKDVAREIFEEIEEMLNCLKKYNPYDNMINVVGQNFAELKKKYESEDT